MRQLTTLAAATLLTGAIACASQGTLPGGPPDNEPPTVLGFSPESGTVNFRGRAVTVQFDETVSDRGTGANALEALVLISPRDGEPRVAWARNRIAVRPRDGFLPNTAYRVTIGPGIADIRGNRTDSAYSVVFSTGPTIPGGAISGIAFDWPGQALARTAFIEATRLPDSTVFVAPADTNGTFIVGPLPPATYIVQGYVDQNKNRVRDRTETWDSITVVVGTAPVTGVELLFAQRDTLPPRIQGVDVRDSMTLALEFDRPLAPDQRFAASQIRIVRADSTVVPVAALYTREAYDSLHRAATDTLTPLPDSTRADTLRAGKPPADTLARRRRPSRPAPPRTFVIVLGEPLEPGTTYRVTATGFRSLTGQTAVVTRTFSIPPRVAPPVPPDTTRAPGDTLRRRPSTAPRDTLRSTPPPARRKP